MLLVLDLQAKQSAESLKKFINNLEYIYPL